MIIKIKKLILEAGIVDDVQQSIKNGLVGHDSVGKAIDRQTAGEIQNIRKEVDSKIKGPVAKKTFETKKVITESIIGTKHALVQGGMLPTNTVKKSKELKQLLNPERGTIQVNNYNGRASQGLPPGERSKQVLNESTGPSDMGKVKPLPKRVSGILTDARNDKNATLKDAVDIPSANVILKNNPTHNAKFGQKILRDERNQTNANGEGVR